MLLGGKYVTRVVGAVPVMVVLGLVVAVPPEMFADVPAPDGAGPVVDAGAGSGDLQAH